jgi:hypothetical protein
MKRICGAMLLGLAAAVVLPACSDTSTESNPPVQTVTSKMELRNGMRKLWTEHVLWTRVFIIDDIAGLGDTKVATDRLLQNQVDIGDAIKPFYGDAAGSKLTALLKQHILGAAAVLEAAKAGDKQTFAKANAAWYANADQISKFLSDANPNLSFDAMKKMMDTHLDQTLAEATARLEGKWTDDVKAYDAVVDHIQMMADTLTSAVIAQFPEMVADDPMTAGDMALDIDMRSLWEDHVMWTRVFLIDDIAGLPDTDASTARLLRNQVDIGDAIKPFYGDAAGAQLTALLKQHILLAAAVVNAAKQPMTKPVGASSSNPKAEWYANANQIADFLAAANPHFDKAELRAMMKTHLDQTLAEATARLEMHWSADITDYDHVEDHILSMADMLGEGIDLQFPDKVNGLAK